MTNRACLHRGPGSARPPLAIIALLAAILLASCVSLGDDRFLLASLDDRAKANALTEAGIEQYTVRLVQRAEYEAVKEVRRYFDAALRYDPSNARAKQYLDLVDTYFATRLKANVKEADRLAAKKGRTRDEDFLMVAAVGKAARLDAQNEDVRRLQRETSDLRDALVKEGIALERATADRITDKVTGDTRDRLWVDAYLAAGRVLAIDARNETALAEQARTRRRGGGGVRAPDQRGPRPAGRAQVHGLQGRDRGDERALAPLGGPRRGFRADRKLRAELPLGTVAHRPEGVRVGRRPGEGRARRAALRGCDGAPEAHL